MAILPCPRFVRGRGFLPFHECWSAGSGGHRPPGPALFFWTFPMEWTRRHEKWNPAPHKKKGMTNKYCHAELDSASTLNIVHRFRNEFGMTLRNELFGHPVFLNPVCNIVDKPLGLFPSKTWIGYGLTVRSLPNLLATVLYVALYHESLDELPYPLVVRA